METAQWRDYLADAIRYWEPRRILYNLLLAAIVAIHFVKGLPLSKNVAQFNAVKKLVPAYMIPLQVHHLDALPLGPTGKIDRRALVRLLDENRV